MTPTQVLLTLTGLLAAVIQLQLWRERAERYRKRHEALERAVRASGELRKLENRRRE